MKIIVYILISTALFSCVNSEKEFSEKDAYDLINNYFIQDIANKNQKVILNQFQLFADFSSVNLDLYMKLEKPESADHDIPEIIMPHDSPIEPDRFTENKWTENKLNSVSLLNYSIFHKQTDSILPIDIIMDEYGTNIIHNVSYPFYDSKNKIAIIIDEPDRVGKMESIRISHCYIYIKENNRWKSLKEYGTINIWMTLQNYLRNTSL